MPNYVVLEVESRVKDSREGLQLDHMRLRRLHLVMNVSNMNSNEPEKIWRMETTGRIPICGIAFSDTFSFREPFSLYSNQ